jgi:ABC-type transport system involved in multi-copper enzyme maturation permease subunit
MTCFAWLQARTQTLATLAVLAALAIVAAITGIRLSHLYDSLVAPCATGDCGLAAGQFSAHYSWLQSGFELILRLAPAIIGLFWGAPLLARELETGTYRLVWTQGVTRSKWLTTKLLVVGASAVASAAVLTFTTTWWFRAVDMAGGNQYALFDRRNLAPVAYALFAFALGAFLGTVIRRTLPAMAATLGIFAFTRIAVTTWVRPHLLASLHKSMSLLSAGGFGFTSTRDGTVDLVARDTSIPNAWVQSSQIVNSSGHTASVAQRGAFILQNCPTIANHTDVPPGQVGPGGPSAFETCRQQAAHVFHLAVSYQPAGRYWTFQWLEAAIYVALALVAVVGCYWWVTRRAN